MIEIEKPNISTSDLSDDGSNGIFIVEPLERGYGTTLGNSLRRVMLSSLPGVAVTNIKIDGVLHEFSTIPGVTEDVTEIVLNVKGITAKLHCNGPKTVVIDVTGERNITAGDIKQDSDIEILNPEHHIATISENERFYMELTFSHGRGYVSQERNKQLHTQSLGVAASAPIGTIYTDSIYTPVYNVKYTVDNTRVGSNITDYDKLTLEVLTDGFNDFNDCEFDENELFEIYKRSEIFPKKDFFAFSSTMKSSSSPATFSMPCFESISLTLHILRRFTNSFAIL